MRPCSCRPLRARRWRRSSGLVVALRGVEQVVEAGEGYRRASAPSTSTPSRETRPVIAPSIAIRWSPRASNVPPPRIREGTPRTVKPSGVARMCAPQLAEAVDHGLDPVGLLRAQLGGAAERAVSSARTASRAKSGSSSTSSGTSAALMVVADELRRADVEVAGRLTADPAAVEDGDVRPHPLEHRRGGPSGAGSG